MGRPGFHLAGEETTPEKSDDLPEASSQLVA